MALRRRIARDSMRVSSIVLLIVASLLMVSCDSLTTYSEVHDFEDFRWQTSDSVEFNFRPSDSLSTGKIAVAMRYRPTLVDSSLTLYIKGSHRGKSSLDSLPIVLPRGSGDRIRTTTLLFRESIVWPSTESVELKFSTNRELEGLYSLSVEIDNAKHIK